MRKFIRFSLMLSFVFLLSGCAQSYNLLKPTEIVYTDTNNFEEISLNYHYDILYKEGNLKIANKERKNNIKLVAVKITNNSDRVINIGGNAAFFSGNSMIFPMDAISIRNNLKQSVPGYLLYLLLTPLTITLNNTTRLPVGLILGPAISGGNMLAAGNANKYLYNDLVQYDILNRDIQIGETVFGLVGFRNLDYVPLTIKLIK